MGKNKTRKTRWRALSITGEHSDSEESNSTTASRLPQDYQPKSYYNKFSYSSQSTPRRRYQHEGTKSTRSSSTASENKITFNEDEYTRITTPRQDVLFKKGYLNKPKTYQTQTSTGTSTTSTGNSTGNGTPDHQSTDLDYESQFVFPNGFVDHNGIYYVNSFESYPLMLYNPPTYYPEFSNCTSKRYSTGSLTGSTSPNNEEATSQDVSGGETSNNMSDYSGHHPVYNMVYPGYFVNGICSSNDLTNGQCSTDQSRRIKKRRRRKSSKSQVEHDSSEFTDDETYSDDEEISADNQILSNTPTDCRRDAENTPNVEIEEKCNGQEEDTSLETQVSPTNAQDISEEKLQKSEMATEENSNTLPSVPASKQKDDCSSKESSNNSLEVVHNQTCDEKIRSATDSPKFQKYDLKPDAEEFVPRAYRNSEISVSPNLQFIKVPPNFMPIPIMPIGEFEGQTFNPAFIPSRVPVNFLPPDPKFLTGFIPNATFASKSNTNEMLTHAKETNEVEACDNPTIAEDVGIHQNSEILEQDFVQSGSKTIDIATVVSKLQEAAKEQEEEDAKKTAKDCEANTSPRRKYDNKFRANPKYKNPYFKRNNFSNPQYSPQRNYQQTNDDSIGNKSVKSNSTIEKVQAAHVSPYKDICSGQTKNRYPKNSEIPNNPSSNEVSEAFRKTPKSSPRNNWNQYGTSKWQQNGFHKRNLEDFKPKQHTENDIKPRQPNKNYSEMVKNKVSHQSQQNSYENPNEERKSRIESPKREVKTGSPKLVSAYPKQPNEWISVSSKKKRKNRNLEENEVATEDQLEEDKVVEHSQDELFESYDVQLLVDVVVPTAESSQEVLNSETQEEQVSEATVNNETEKEACATQIETNTSLDIESVSDIQNQITTSSELVKVKNTMEPQDTYANKCIEEPVLEKPQQDEISLENVCTENLPINPLASLEKISAEELPEFNVVNTLQQETNTKGKKKSKKGGQKPLTKRVMITDVDLSMECKDAKTPIKKIVKKIEEKIDPLPKLKILNVISTEDQPKATTDEEQKKNKRKKKASKTQASSNLSSSNTTLYAADDCYDFLLDSALTEEHVEKTNIEISQELDKIIQKGMYSSLEEKIKSLNMDENDDFFKSVFSKISSRESSIEKTCPEIPDLSKILQNTSPLLKTGSVSEGNNYQKIEINKILPDLESPGEIGIFLENPELTDILQDQILTTNTETEVTFGEDAATNHANEPESEADPKNLYPITQAVKDWMCRTRETTPDVELLKSPSTIFKEFCDSDSESECYTSDTKNSSSTLEEPTVAFDDEEVTLFSKDIDPKSREGSVEQTDLLEFWDNEAETCRKPNVSEEDASTHDSHCHNGHIDQGEEAIEVYHSKYGQNEDYLRIQREIKEKSNNFNYPKHGNLPYRAICCSIM